MKLHVGQRAPSFSLPSHLGNKVSLAEYSGKNLVLAFYPLAWTPI
jgi:peroxiredoxin